MSGPVTRSQTRNAIPAQPHAIPVQPHQAQPVMPRAVTRSQTRNAIPEQSHQAHPGLLLSCKHELGTNSRLVTTDRIKQVPVPDITDFMSQYTSAVQKNMVEVMNMLLKKVKPTHVVKWARDQCILEARVRARVQRQARNPQGSEVQHPDSPDPDPPDPDPPDPDPQINSETNHQEPQEDGLEQPESPHPETPLAEVQHPDPPNPQVNSETDRQEQVEDAGGQQQPESPHPEQPPLERQEVNSETIRREPLQVGGLQQPESPHLDPPLTESLPTVCDDDDDDDDDDDRAYPRHFVVGESSARAQPSRFVLGESSARGANAVAEPGAGIIPGLSVQEANAAVNAGNDVEVELVKSVDTLVKLLKSKRVQFYEGSLNSAIAFTEMMWVLLKEMPLTVSRVKTETIQKSYVNRMARNWSLPLDNIPDGEAVLTDLVGSELFDDWVLRTEIMGNTKFVYFVNKVDREEAAQSEVAIMEKLITDLQAASKKLKEHRSASKRRKE